jgi:hypothetical protein
MNALKTFQTFVTAADAPDVRHALLLESARCIFGAVPSGFLQASETNSDSGKAFDGIAKLGK